VTHVKITHIGGPTTLIEFAGWRILTDPTFDPPGKRYFFGWGTTSKKTVGPSMSPDELGAIDAVLVSHHHHGDNLDPTGRDLLPGWGTTVTTVKAAQRLGGNSVGLSPWGTTTLEAPGKPTVTITATPCRHGPPGMDPITGPVVGFVLAWDGQANGALWITGDTVLYPGLREVPARIDVGSVVLHLGAVRFAYLTGPLRYTMDARESVELLELIDPAAVVPVHYEGWTHFKQGRRAAEPVLSASRFADRVHWIDPGERTEFEA
jgi:L-ascorbate metabolism protein UlaG (beta-lactamase superfamily)